MSLRNKTDSGVYNREYLYNFRIAAAGMIKAIIAARAALDPDFLTVQTRKLWDIELCPIDKRTCQARLRQASQLFRKFEEKFALYGESLAATESAFAANFEQLRDMTLLFSRVADLDGAANQIRNGGAVDWSDVAQWNDLVSIRKRLDGLPDRLNITQDNSPTKTEAKVLSGYQLAVTENVGKGDRPTDREAYDWLKLNSNLPRVKGYEPTTKFETWARRLRAARKRTGQSKNNPRQKTDRRRNGKVIMQSDDDGTENASDSGGN